MALLLLYLPVHSARDKFLPAPVASSCSAFFILKGLVTGVDWESAWHLFTKKFLDLWLSIFPVGGGLGAS